jgi:hypothetical protein
MKRTTVKNKQQKAKPMADPKKFKYHFLTGKQPVITKEFENNEAAIAEGKNVKGIIRIQRDDSGKFIWEAPAKTEAAEAPAAEAPTAQGTRGGNRQ